MLHAHVGFLHDSCTNLPQGQGQGQGLFDQPCEGHEYTNTIHMYYWSSSNTNNYISVKNAQKFSKTYIYMKRMSLSTRHVMRLSTVRGDSEIACSPISMWWEDKTWSDMISSPSISHKGHGLIPFPWCAMSLARFWRPRRCLLPRCSALSHIFVQLPPREVISAIPAYWSRMHALSTATMSSS